MRSARILVLGFAIAVGGMPIRAQDPGPPGPLFAVRVSDIPRFPPSARPRVTVMLDFQYCLKTGECAPGDPGIDYRIQGWSLGICHDPALLVAVDAVTHPDTLTVYRGRPPAFLAEEVHEDGATQGLVFDFFPTAHIASRNDLGTLLVTYAAAAPRYCPADPVTTELTVCNTVGDPPVETVMVVWGQGYDPDATEGGRVTLVCGPRSPHFIRGDANGEGIVNVADAIWILLDLFADDAEPKSTLRCPDAADANDDGRVDVSDSVTILTWAFGGGPAPPAPGTRSCGEDPTADDLAHCTYGACR